MRSSKPSHRLLVEIRVVEMKPVAITKQLVTIQQKVHHHHHHHHRRFIVIDVSGAMALDEGLSGLIVAGVIAGVLLIVGIISVTVWCFVRNRIYDDDKESLDIISPKITPRYSRFPPTMKFRSFAPTSTRPRPPVTFFTVRDSPRSAGGNVLPVTGTPYLFQPRGPVMYVDEGGVSARSSVKDREGHYRRSTKSNGHAGSMKIRELHSGDEMLNFESSDDENGNKKKTLDNRSRSKSRDRKYVKNPDHKSHHRHKPANHTGHRSRSNSRGRNKSVESRNSVNSNTIVAQPGDIILNPVSIFDSQPPPLAHNLSQSTRPESIFVPVLTRNPVSQTVPTSSAFQPYTRDEDPPLETPREDYLTPRSMSEMPSTIQPESSRSDFITPSADYPRNQDFTYPSRPSSDDPFISPRPPTPEFDADSILYVAQGQVTTVVSKSPTGNVFESTPRPETPPVAPKPPPPPPMPVVDGSTESGYYLSAVHRPPTPPPGKLFPVTTDVESILNSASSSGSSTKRPTNMGVSPLHSAMMAEIKNRRQRRPSNEDIGLPPPSPSSGESPSLSFRRTNDSPILHFGRYNESPIPSFRRQNDSPLISDARRPSNVQFTAEPPEIIPSGLDAESPDTGSMHYEPGSVSSAFDAVMSSGVPSSAPAPPPPPPPPPLPSGR
ncbi:hypothetical protein LOTGIDRAFT_230123 [Lottia gigantea]|uniref:Uncharacterized protein n=1 Tax=Lottia gigantea TaxID=225164 RepID=V4BCE0_LOTGI|nr:hypothetical protein LOTGIDRAFT_230123 [Lottia gigantea]ESP03807.1 hypothetical protein LOTGIDRAFT_230123 [Lottia gigantea]